MSLHVLWVDDEPQSLRYERRLAELHDWNIESALNTESALDLTSKNTFDLLIVDIILPRSQYEQDRGYVNADAGIELLRALRDPGRCASTPADVPIAVITAVVSSEKLARIKDLLGANPKYLAKPIAEEEYERLVTNLSQALSTSSRS